MIDLAFLGTGGTLPMPDRALSSLYIRVGGRAAVIDCGEGTQISIMRLGWGIRNIEAILFTHFHADHCSGLPGLLLAIAKAKREEPLHLYGPTGLERTVSSLRVIAPCLTYPIVFHEMAPAQPGNFRLLGMEVTPFAARHEMLCLGYDFRLPRPPAFDPVRARALDIPVTLWGKLQRGETVEHAGKVFTPDQVLGQARQGIHFLYSTDTRPVPSIAQLGREADLMILEGMYGSEDKEPLARKNSHMLFRESAALAREANARRLLLTHFSTSIEEPAEYLPAARAIFPNTDCAADLMNLTLHYPEQK